MNSYKEHYQKCKELYSGTPSTGIGLYDVRFFKNMIPITDKKYTSLVSDLASKSAQRFANNGTDIMRLNNSLRVSSFSEIPEIIPLVNYIAPHLEERIFQSNLKVEHAHLYRSLPNTFPESSWVWHYDNCPDEYIKLGIYLNNVDKKTGAMQVMCRGEIEFYKIETSALDNCNEKNTRKKKRKFVKPGGGKTARAPESFIKEIQRSDYQPKNIVGPQATNFLFNPNIIHRATVPEPNSYRDALFLFMRPTLAPVSYNLEAFEYDADVDVKDYDYD